jgi:cytochrome c oxidase subunit 1
MSESFIRKYVFSTDHKMIARQYLFTGLAMAVVGGLLAYLIRHQLAYPGEKVLGYHVLTPEVYNAMVTMHGTVMVFWVAMPILIGAFGNFLIPLMIGADDMAFPRLNMLSYWTFFLSTIVLIVSFFVPGGAAAAGWTSYPTLSVQGAGGNHWGQILWILSVALEFASILMGGVNYLTTPLNLRAPGMKLFDMPIFVWMQMAASLIFMLSVGPLIGGAVLMLFDLLFQTGVYMPEKGGDPLLWQHLFWFFGHPEVYVILLPALGIIGEVMPVFSRKALFGYKPMVYSTILAGILSFLVWAHHQFISGMDPRMALPFSITTIIISVPFAIVIFSMIATLWRGSIQFTTAMLFALGMLGEFLIGGTTGIINGSAAADIYVHDTYYIVGHFHYTLFPAVFYGMFAGLYYWWPKMFGRHLDERLGKVHFWGTTVFFNMTFIPMLLMGMGGHQRRIFDPRIFSYTAPMQKLHVITTFGLYGLLFYQIPFIIAFVKGLMGPRTAEKNPWRANTLEWFAPSPPGHGNFEVMPEVFRGPYEFSRPDTLEDFVPQWQPPGDTAVNQPPREGQSIAVPSHV